MKKRYKKIAALICGITLLVGILPTQLFARAKATQGSISCYDVCGRLWCIDNGEQGPPSAAAYDAMEKYLNSFFC